MYILVIKKADRKPYLALAIYCKFRNFARILLLRIASKDLYRQKFATGA